MADIMLGQLLHRPTIDPISGDSPLPVQLSGSKAEIVQDATTGVTVAAGATVTAIFTLYIHDYRRVTFAAKAPVATKTAIAYRLFTMDGTPLSGSDTLSTPSTSEAVHVTFDVTAPRTYMRINNQSVAQQTYSVDYYLWPN